jgi:hypothetical protein
MQYRYKLTAIDTQGRNREYFTNDPMDAMVHLLSARKEGFTQIKGYYRDHHNAWVLMEASKGSK